MFVFSVLPCALPAIPIQAMIQGYHAYTFQGYITGLPLTFPFSVCFMLCVLACFVCVFCPTGSFHGGDVSVKLHSEEHLISARTDLPKPSEGSKTLEPLLATEPKWRQQRWVPFSVQRLHAFARSLHTFNCSKKMNCELCKAVYTSIASKAL